MTHPFAVMLSRIKFIIYLTYARLNAQLLRFRGVNVGKKANIVGQPRIRMRRGGKIILGEGVCLQSSRLFAQLISRPVFLSATAPEAVIELKDYCAISGSSILCKGKVSIGYRTLIGHDTFITDFSNHAYSQELGWATPFNLDRTAQSVIIGDKCFIGSNCIITAGVTIGNNCVVAAGTVLRQDVPDGHIASGNPAVISPLPKRLGGPGRHKSKEAADQTD